MWNLALTDKVKTIIRQQVVTPVMCRRHRQLAQPKNTVTGVTAVAGDLIRESAKTGNVGMNIVAPPRIVDPIHIQVFSAQRRGKATLPWAVLLVQQRKQVTVPDLQNQKFNKIVNYYILQWKTAARKFYSLPTMI